MAMSRHPRPISVIDLTQGRYAVLAAGAYKALGVDVSDVRSQDNVPKYFDLMQNQFAMDEWSRIRARPTQGLQLVGWCGGDD